MIIEMPFQSVLDSPHDAEAQYTCLASENDFIPLYAGLQGELIKSGKGKDFIYDLSHSNTVSDCSRYSTFCDIIRNGDLDSTSKITHSSITEKYYASNGLVTHKNEKTSVLTPLLVLCVKARYLYNIDKQNINPLHLCLLIDKRFESDVEHFKLFRNVNKYYIKPISEIVDVLYSNDISMLCYNYRTLTLPKFKTIRGVIEHTKSINSIVEAVLKK